MPDVLTLGECMAVLYPPDPITLDDTSSLLLDIGGAEANFSIGMQRLGFDVSYMSLVGDDPFGRRIRSILSKEGVDVSQLRTESSAPTGVFFREWMPDGARRVYYYRANSAASRMSPDDLNPDWFAGARLVHLTGITPALSASCAATIARAFELAHAAGALVSFDPNYRARLWTPEVAQAALLPFVEQADILLVGHEDAQAILGVDDERVFSHAAVQNAQAVVLKMAERGAMARAAGREVNVPAASVDQVVDPVGAGDGFDAGFLAGWLRGEDLENALRLGAKIGAASVGALGDYAGYPRM